MLTTLARLATTATLGLTLVACAPSATIVSVTILGGDRTLPHGTGITLEVEVQTTGGASTTVSWTSSDTDVATVDPQGTLTSHTAGTTDITATSTTDPTKSDTITVTVNPPGTHAWTRQFGTAYDDFATGIAADADGDVFATGYTYGDLEGTNAGDSDAFVRSYGSDGALRWTRQFGTISGDFAREIATDASGNVYTAGYTTGALEGENAGNSDAFIRSYDSNGNHRWTRQFGTIGSDLTSGIATDANGNVYATGYTYGDLEGINAGEGDVFLRSYDSTGNLRWTRQFGTSGDDYGYGVATDTNGNVFITGSTDDSLEGSSAGGGDAFIRSYDSNGVLRWTRQFGTTIDDNGEGIATDANGNVYATGSTSGTLAGSSAGNFDAFVRSYDTNGTLRWTRQFGTSSDDVALTIATDVHGNVYAAGFTGGALEGTSVGNNDAFVRSYDSSGTHRWTRQFGTNGNDYALGIAMDAHGHAYATGYTEGALEGANTGNLDAFVRKYDP